MRRDPDAFFARKKTNKIAFEFVLEELAGLDPWTRPMFGCTAVYVEEKIVFILRGGKGDGDDGVWIATTKENHPSLRRELPNMRSIAVFGAGETGWQVLPVDGDDFEESVLRACALVRTRDPRIGKVPKPKKRKERQPKGGPRAKPKRARRKG